MIPDHFVQFYEGEEYLYDVIWNFISPQFGRRDAVILIATSHHLAALTHMLKVRHLNLTAYISSGQLLLTDANELVDNIVVNGVVDPGKFDDFIENTIGELVKHFGKVYAYGELVNILCSRNEHHLAIVLEKLWHSAISRFQSLSLLCGYDVNNFVDEEIWFDEVCNNHSRVAPCEGYAELHATGEKDIIVAKLQQRLKAFQMELARRKASEKALQESINLQSIRAGDALFHERQSFYALLQVLPVGVYGTQLSNGTDIFVNPAFLELSGLAREDVLGCAWLRAVHPEDRDNVARNLQSWKGIPIGTEGKIQYRFVHPESGSVRWVAGETVSNMEGFIHTIVDLTELKAEEQRRLREKKLAEEIQRNHIDDRKKEHQDQYIDTLCHELRNPLSGISGNLELVSLALAVRQEILSKKSLDEKDIETLKKLLEEDHESVEAVETCVTHLTAITDDVLNLPKLELGILALQHIPYQPKEIVVGVKKMFATQSKKKGIDFKLVMPTEDLRVVGDPHCLTQILVNLVSNSIKFAENGSITVSLEITDDHGEEIRLCMKVQDTGIGLTDDEQAALFHRYAQTTSSFHQYQGSGLGLWISKRLVELMGGVIYIESKKDVGSTFTFTFLGTKESGPNVSSNSEFCQSANKNKSAPLEKSMHASSTKRCLIVDDNDINQRMMFRLISPLGFDCVVAGNGQEALKILDHQNVDLIIMDVEMPIMDGMTATVEIRKREQALGNKSHISIIGLSGNARENHSKEAYDKGMDWYLTKPVRKNHLYKVINQIT